MTCQQVVFAGLNCLVEIDTQPTAPASYTAFLSLLEDDGAIVRPLVRLDGRRISIQATSAPRALDSAITYLERRFGALSLPEHECALANSAIGRPVVVAD